MNILRKVLVTLLIGFTALLASKVYQLELEKIEKKNDLIELSKIKYGLFNADEWKIILAEIITTKVEEFNLDDTNKEEMRTRIENLLTVAINDLEDRYYEQKSKSIVGILQGGVAAVTGTFGKIKQDIPVFTDQILNFLNDKQNREAIRKYFIKKLNEYADSTFSQTDYSTVDKIIAKYQQQDIPTTKTYLTTQIENIYHKNERYKITLMIIAGISLLIIFLVPHFDRPELMLFLIFSALYLLVGVILPMIEIDARISEMNFTLLGESISFTDQVLYYKSKSILEVVRLMIFQERIDLVAVGILVLTFSVLFPVSKLLCSLAFLLKDEVKNNAIVSFIVFKSGKWSMADVMVIAIFMAYIGFDGIITEQLTQLEDISKGFDLLTTNKSNLLFGFYSFIAFVLLSLALSQKMPAEQ